MKDLKLLMIFFIAALALSCGVDSNKALQDAVLKYKNGETGSLADIEKYFIKAVSERELLINDYEISGAVFFTQSKKHLNIFLPIERKFILPDNLRIRFLDVNDKYGVLSDGNALFLYDTEDEYTAFKPDISATIRAVAVYENRVIYYSNMKIRYFDIPSGENGIVVNKTFKPPYEKFFKVYFFRDNDYLGILSGTAGVYNLSIINLKTETVLEENIKLSSHRLYFNNGTVYYLKGSAGLWELVKCNFTDSSKIVLASFHKIVDILFTPHSVIIEKENGVLVYYYNGSSYNAPFKYRLAGTSGSNIILKYKTVTYIVDSDKMNIKLKRLKDELPGVFKKN